MCSYSFCLCKTVFRSAAVPHCRYIGLRRICAVIFFTDSIYMVTYFTKESKDFLQNPGKAAGKIIQKRFVQRPGKIFSLKLSALSIVTIKLSENLARHLLLRCDARTKLRSLAQQTQTGKDADRKRYKKSVCL